MYLEDFGRFQTGCEKLKNAIADARRLAPTLKPILIVGESGTGRTEMALEIVEKSSRAQGTIKNLRAGDILQDDLNYGTVIVEDVQDFNLSDQELILKRILQSSSVLRGPRWVVTAKTDLLARVRKNQFSVRLYQVLSEQTISMPNLEERRSDVSFLISQQIEVLNSVCGISRKLSSNYEEKLTNMNFRRNFSDLFEQVEAAHLKSDGPLIDLTEMHVETAQRGLTISEMERKLILQTLQITDQNRTKAAELLGISIRTLRNKLNEYREEGVL